MRKQNSGFTLIELLVGITITVAIFIVATSLVVNIFSSTTKSKQKEILEQVKNDLQAEFGNSVRWADTISFVGGELAIDSIEYSLVDGAIHKNGEQITPNEVEVTSFEVINHESPPTNNSPVNSGTGITGHYFNSEDFTELAFIQTDYNIDFNWGSASPDVLIDENTFSVRYVGQIEAPATSEYTFYLASDDGARLWVDEQLVIDDWDLSGLGERNGRINLVSGERYDIRLEYYENFGDARVSLDWSYFGTPRQIVPTSRLYPNTSRGSIEILLEMNNRNSSSVVETMKLLLSPRSGNIGVVE